MNNFGTLYRYEWKKILGKKIVLISFAVCAITIIISLIAPFLGSYYIDGKLIDTNYNMYQTDRRYAEAMSGREVAQSLMEETVAAYGKIPDTPGRHYTSTDEYQQYARPYSAIFNFMRAAAGMQTSELMSTWQPEEADWYGKRQEYLASMWEELGLSAGEINFWREREERIAIPYVYQVYDGYDAIISSYQTVGVLVLMIIAICLSGMFSEEHTRKTDQIILCSPLGQRKLYWAKIAAGISFAVIGTSLLLLFVLITTLCMYGADGFHAAFQWIYATSSEPVSCGQAVIIAYGNMLIAAVLISVFVMVLSELLHSNIAPLAISVALLIVTMIVNVPEQYRVLSQMWDWFPWCFLAPWNVFGQYTISVFGHYFTAWQAVPVIYIISSAAIAIIGKPIYQRFQVSGR